jgi:hypothetical protein
MGILSRRFEWATNQPHSSLLGVVPALLLIAVKTRQCNVLPGRLSATPYGLPPAPHAYVRQIKTAALPVSQPSLALLTHSET